MIYCIDTSSLIYGWNEKYPPEVFPSLWENIEKCIDDKHLVSTEEVREELTEGNDELADWAKTKGDFFLPLETDIQTEVGNILADPINSKVLDSRKVGKTEADVFVIATAKIHGLKVISDETKYVQPQDILVARKISIRNVCENISIEHLTFLEFIIEQGWKF